MQAIEQLNTLSRTIEQLRLQMDQTAAQLPEYPVVMAMKGVGPSLGPQIMAEIGDVRRFSRRGALTALQGLIQVSINPAPIIRKVYELLNVDLLNCVNHCFK